jgi:endonuclease G, mitochondrial
MKLDIDDLKTSESRFGERKTRTNIEKNVDLEYKAKEEKNLEARRVLIESISNEPANFAYERAIGNNDSVFSNFVELILEAKRKIGRLIIKDDIKNYGYATGFMISEDLLITNWHVFKTENDVMQSIVQFNYELDITGNPTKEINFKIDKNKFFHSCKVLDYCIVGVEGQDITNTVKINEIGYLFLDKVDGKLGPIGKEKLNIIHHPLGNYKQLSIRENTFIKILDNTLWYSSDTAQGSSGSPVFNDQWQVVALHHMGVALKDDKGNYIDKSGKIIPIVEGKIEEKDVVWVANEGIRISKIIIDILKEKGNNILIKKLNFTPNTPQPFVKAKEKNQDLIERESSDQNTKDIIIKIPTSVIQELGVVNVSISGKKEDNPKTLFQRDTKFITQDNNIIFAENEIYETEIDFSSCNGYSPKFLGTGNIIKMPLPSNSLKAKLAKITETDDIELKYHKYSIYFHALRKMPVISAINVDGSVLKRLDKTTSENKWFRDRRIDKEIQLDTSFYRKSGFDRGHMSRKEDANWGATAEEALRNAQYTCAYTNACPQVKALNQQGGLWGKLEKLILENGVQKEQGKEAKITVFNGPIFNISDPLYKSVQIPMDFYKVIVYTAIDGKLKATAFILSQKDLLSDINFDEEAIDLSGNEQFKEYQCSIKSLSKKTKLDFSILYPIDTFDIVNDKEVALVIEENFLRKLNLNHP